MEGESSLVISNIGSPMKVFEEATNYSRCNSIILTGVVKKK
jgi:hypothetical protein